MFLHLLVTLWRMCGKSSAKEEEKKVSPLKKVQMLSVPVFKLLDIVTDLMLVNQMFSLETDVRAQLAADAIGALGDSDGSLFWQTYNDMSVAVNGYSYNGVRTQVIGFMVAGIVMDVVSGVFMAIGSKKGEVTCSVVGLLVEDVPQCIMSFRVLALLEGIS
jgi:hypothetical protein